MGGAPKQKTILNLGCDFDVAETDRPTVTRGVVADLHLNFIVLWRALSAIMARNSGFQLENSQEIHHMGQIMHAHVYII